MTEKKFSADLNLDDEAEAREFLEMHATLDYRASANRLGFTGKGSWLAARALYHYANNKCVAIDCRKGGRPIAARIYEQICDRIYHENIQPNIDCW